MRHRIVRLIAATALLASVATPAFAATYQNYSIILPRLKGDVYTSAKTVSAYSDFGVKHKYSGGVDVNFQVCDTQHNPLGPIVRIKPGGSAAPRVDLWYNNSSSARTIVVRMEAAVLKVVEVLAEGTWVWNY